MTGGIVCIVHITGLVSYRHRRQSGSRGDFETERWSISQDEADVVRLDERDFSFDDRGGFGQKCAARAERFIEVHGQAILLLDADVDGLLRVFHCAGRIGE